jgi:DNA-binding MarR family transcriptional regulator
VGHNNIAISTIVPDIVFPTMLTPPPTPLATPPGVLDERVSSAGLLLAMLGRQAMRQLRAVHIEHGLSPRQFQLLGLLHDRGAMTQRELGSVMDVDPSILVTLLNPLETRGYVSRQRDPSDRRRHIVNLSSDGAEHLTQAARAQSEAEDAFFAGLDGDQRDQLRALLLMLRDTLDGPVTEDCAGTSGPQGE